MCGITGSFAWAASAAPVDRDELRRMRDHMAARGPDGAGEWFSASGRTGLAHRRLAIIDLSERGAQPMSSADGRFQITFNGEIYNYRELRERLLADGAELHTESDTEVLLHLYARLGADAVHELRGMYAFAIWDELKDELFLARGPFGIKPLYYADTSGTFRFASQVRTLLLAPVDSSPEPAGHAGFYLWGSVPEPWTLYRGIRALPPGHTMVVGRNGIRPSRPFCNIASILREAAATPAFGSRETALEAISAAIKDSVLAHQVADVPVGVFLSAGLDSCIIASAAAFHGANSYTLTLGFREFAGTLEDEVPLAEQVARSLDAWHSTLMTSREDFEGEREKLFAAMDQPSIDGVNTWFVARAAAQMQLKVALSGLGGDELFASYPSFRQLPRLVHYSRLWAPWVGKAFRRAVSPLASRLTSPKYAGLLEYGHDLGGAYLLRRCLFAPWELPSVMDPDMARQGLEDLQTLAALDRSWRGIIDDRLAVSALEMQWYMRNQLLRDADWAGMAQSVEIRVPFLDVELLRKAAPWFAAWPDIRKPEIAAIAWPSLPPQLLSRPKTGFSVPVREWIRPEKPGAYQERGLRGWARYVHRQFAP
jgi:asparagine synthase (glutamine-hydrolysing)